MKQSRRIHLCKRLFFLSNAFFLFQSNAQSKIVADASSTFYAEQAPTADQINSVYNLQNAYVTTVAPTPQDPIALAEMEFNKSQEQAQKAQSKNSLLSICAALLSPLASLFGGEKKSKETVEFASDMVDIGNHFNDSMGFQYEPGFNKEVVGKAARVPDNIKAEFSSGCNNFMTPDGKLGPWGRTVLSEISRDPLYSYHMPSDVEKLCPNARRMSAEQRKLFWVWVFKSMASSESDCNPNTKTYYQGDVNGGLLQLDRDRCGNVNLFNPHNNLRCGVKKLASEMRIRSTLTAAHSKNSSGTYWAVLRSDGTPLSNVQARSPARRKEVNGSLKTQKLISEFYYCKPMAQ